MFGLLLRGPRFDSIEQEASTPQLTRLTREADMLRTMMLRCQYFGVYCIRLYRLRDPMVVVVVVLGHQNTRRILRATHILATPLNILTYDALF